MKERGTIPLQSLENNSIKMKCLMACGKLNLPYGLIHNRFPGLEIRNAFHIFDRERKYIPDFYLPNIQCYVEIKGWKTKKDEAKWRDFPENLLILSGSDLMLLGLDIKAKEWK